MKAFTTLSSIAAPLYIPNIDTDTIIPSREITSVGRDGLGAGAFANWRYNNPVDCQGRRGLNPNFILNQTPYDSSSILIGGPNFGCGSSREAAVWALEQLGIRAIIAPSFGMIFRANCYANAILPIQLSASTVELLVNEAITKKATLTIDLYSRTVVSPTHRTWEFEIDASIRERLLEGLDEIGLTLKHAEAIASFQAKDKKNRPWIWLS